MKVSTLPVNDSKKKNSLPSKLLKPKTFKNAKPKQSKEIKNKIKPVKGPVEQKQKSLASIKSDLIKTILNEKNSLTSIVKVKKNDGKAVPKRRLKQNKPTPNKPKSTAIQPQNQKVAVKNQIDSPGTGKNKKKRNKRKFEKLTRPKTPSKTTKTSKKAKHSELRSNKKSRKMHGSESKQKNKSTKSDPKSEDAKHPCQLRVNKVKALVGSLLKELKTTQDKSELLDLEEPIFLQVECIKIPTCPTKQIRFKLPFPLVNELSDVLLITADLKGAKIYPDRAVEYYTDLLDKHNVKFIQKVIPLRMLRQEYSQYEMKRKLVNQYDVILAEARILPSLPKILGGFALYSRKMPIPVHLHREGDLKQRLQTALSKTQMTIKAEGNISIVQVGHTKMSADNIAANIVEVSRCLDETFPGGWLNVRSLNIKSATSASTLIYFSMVSPNAVPPPVEKVKMPVPVEGELSTYPDMIAVVKPDGSVFLKKEKNTEEIETQFDDELIQAAQKYMQSTKTVRYDSEEEDNGAVEEDFMKNYEAAKKANAVDSDEEKEGEEEEEEEEEDSDDDEPALPPPVTSKKRKMEPAKKQAGKPLNKKQKVDTNPQQQKKPNANKPGPLGTPQKRGNRAGKKNKMSKDQRKALIKRKKAGKK